MTDAGLYSFATRVNRGCLKSLDISYCRSISDDSIEALAKKCTNLEFLNLSGLNRITDEGAKSITHNCWKLTYLSLEDIYLITDDIFFFDFKRDGRQVRAYAYGYTPIFPLRFSSSYLFKILQVDAKVTSEAALLERASGLPMLVELIILQDYQLFLNL